MSGTAQDIAAAEVQAKAARARLMRTAEELKQRVRDEPRILFENGVDRLRVRSTDIAEQTVDAARARPGAAGAIGAGLLLLLLRRPLRRLAGRIFGRRRRLRAQEVQRDWADLG